MSDFKWNTDDADSVVLQHQPRTAIYHTQGGSVVVRQEGEFGEDDELIYLTPHGALVVAWRLIEEAHLVGLPQPSPSLMVESETWPPIAPKPSADPQPETPEPGPLLRVMEGGKGKAA